MGLALLLAWVTDAFAAGFRLERVIGGLNYPVAVAQAPGETHAIYIAELVVGDANQRSSRLGRILRYDLLAKTTNVFLDLSTLVAPNGFNSLLHFAFHPDYGTNGKFYVAYQFIGTTNTARLAEYKVIAGMPIFQRTILEHDIVNGSGHVINMALFKPGGDPNHLYITVGDGALQASAAAYLTNRPQNLAFNYGKILRVDVSDGLDDYPGDPRKNFGIPAINTAAIDPSGRNGEVIASGFRNPWRAGFDPLYGDLYVGDNGMDSAEEVDFIKENVFYPASVEIPDYGWPATEAIYSPVPGANAFVQSLPANPASIFPILSRTHATLPAGFNVPKDGDNSVIGGVVYRGPITEFYGKYIYADFVAARIYRFEFDRSTGPTLFHGNNVANLTEISTQLKATLPGAILNKPVSFYADTVGDLYIVEYGLNSAAKKGIVYKVVAVPLTPTLSQSTYTGGQFRVAVTGAAGEQYAVEMSTNLLDWTVTATEKSPFIHTDTTAASAPYRFYRARHKPQ